MGGRPLLFWQGSIPSRALQLNEAGPLWAERPSPLPARLGQLELPILLVVANRNDTLAQVGRLRLAVPRGAVLEVDSEHDLLAQAPEGTGRVVADWLEEAVQPRVA